MLKAVFFMLIGAAAITFAAFQWRDNHVAHITPHEPSPDRLAGPFRFDTYGPQFAWVDTINGVQQRGVAIATVQVRNREGRVEICGALALSKRRNVDDRALASLKTSFIAFRDIRLPASFIDIAMVPEGMFPEDTDEKIPLHCVLANVAWHKRYHEMDQRNVVRIEPGPGTLEAQRR